MLFALDVSNRQDWTVLAVTGELELATAPQLRQRVVGLVSAGDIRLILELSGVDFIDSVGLGVLVAVLKRVRGRGGEVVVAGAGPRVGDLLRVTRLDEILDLYPDVDAALSAVSVDG